jgi:hypothetical protein
MGAFAFSVAHCTLGDMLIGVFTLGLALLLGRERSPEEWRWRRVALVSALLGAGYTVFSEWLNVAVLRSWVYAEAMPTLRVGIVELGITPLAQWLVIPPSALYSARGAARSD